MIGNKSNLGSSSKYFIIKIKKYKDKTLEIVQSQISNKRFQN